MIIPPETHVVVLDDVTSIHQIWDGRFKNTVSSKLHHFSTPDTIGEWLAHKVNGSIALFLVDFELLGSDLSGLDVIKKLGIQDRAILVTSRYEELMVRESCEALGVKLIPKAMAAFVPIKTQKHVPLRKLDGVLIDDDKLMHMTWRSVAGSRGKNISVYGSPAEFLEDSSSIDPATPAKCLETCRTSDQSLARNHRSETEKSN